MANKTFPQFTKTIVQLPIPSATMTKAEYKAKYGIDLNAIDFPKIIILVDGKDKYPVDEVRVVSTTTEIYAGGKILSIGSTNVSVTANAYSVANAKPVYCHPVNIGYKDSDHEFMITMLIFNNSETAFTFETFNNWLTNLVASITQARILCSGYIILSGVTYPVSYLYATSGSRELIVSPSAVSYILDSFTETAWNAIIPLTFSDGVNKIN